MKLLKYVMLLLCCVALHSMVVAQPVNTPTEWHESMPGSRAGLGPDIFRKGNKFCHKSARTIRTKLDDTGRPVTVSFTTHEACYDIATLTCEGEVVCEGVEVTLKLPVRVVVDYVATPLENKPGDGVFRRTVHPIGESLLPAKDRPNQVTTVWAGAWFLVQFRELTLCDCPLLVQVVTEDEGQFKRNSQANAIPASGVVRFSEVPALDVGPDGEAVNPAREIRQVPASNRTPVTPLGPVVACAFMDAPGNEQTNICNELDSINQTTNRAPEKNNRIISTVCFETYVYCSCPSPNDDENVAVAKLEWGYTATWVLKHSKLKPNGAPNAAFGVAKKLGTLFDVKVDLKEVKLECGPDDTIVSDLVNGGADDGTTD
jgi:hypothetical protein